MSGQRPLVERIARVLAPHMEGGREFDQMPKDRPTLKAWHRANMCSINDATQEDALAAAADFLPIIDAEIAAERERCAKVMDDHCTMFRDRAEKCQVDDASAMNLYEVRMSNADVCENGAAAIRSQPCKS